MKILSTSFALILVPLGYYLGSKAGVDEKIQAENRDVRSERELILNRDKPSSLTTRPDRAKISKQVDDLEEIYRRIGLALEKPTRRGINESVMAIFQMSAEEVEELLEREPDLFFRNNSELSSACFARLIELDPEIALRIASSIETSWRREEFMEMVYREWAEQDPDTAMVAALSLQNTKAKESAFREVIKVVAEMDLESAISLAEDYGKNLNLKPAIKDILTMTAAADPLLALETHLSLLENEAFDGSLVESIKFDIMRVWLNDDLEAAEAYIQQVEDENDQSKYTTMMVAKFINSDPQRTLSMLDSNQDNLNRANLSVILMKTIPRAPDETITWIRANQTGEAKAALLRSSFSRWFNQDDAGASAYFSQVTDPEITRVANSSKLVNLRISNPSKYLRLYPELTDNSNSAKEQFVATLQNLAESDPQSAREYIDQLSDPSVRNLALSVPMD